MESKVELSGHQEDVISDAEIQQHATPFYKNKIFLGAAALMVAGGVAAAIAVPLSSGGGSDTGTTSSRTGGEDVSCDAGCAVGAFSVTTRPDGQFSVARSGRTLFEPSTDGTPIVTARVGNETVVDNHGNLAITDEEISNCGNEITKKAGPTQLDDSTLMFVYEFVGCPGTTAEVNLSVETPESSHLIVDVKVSDPKINRVGLNYASTADQKVYGFGVQYSISNLKGRLVHNIVREKGGGRGLQPITHLLDAVKGGAGGTWEGTYSPANQYLSNDLTSMMLENTEFTTMNFTLNDTTALEVYSDHMIAHILWGETHLDLIESYTEYSGRIPELPEWAGAKAILGTQGGTVNVTKNVDQALEAGAIVGSIWIQDWVGKRKTVLGSRLVWNWEVDVIQYPDWDEFVANLTKKGINTMTYINPFVTNSTADLVAAGHYTRDLYAEGVEGGYFVQDLNGKTIDLDQDGFFAALVDFTNPDAWDWYKNTVIKKNMLDRGHMGYMCDFGEQFPYDNVKLFDGSDPKAYHNKYPVEWGRMNQEAIEEEGLTGQVMYFMRAGFSQTPKYSTLMWTGDQLSSYDEYNGMKTAVIAMIGAGISGYSLEHSDIGGYVAISMGPLQFIRTKEMLMRWCELAAFQSAYRTHEGTLPEKNWQFNSDEETLQQWTHFSQVFNAWYFYRKELMHEAETKGHPVARHMFLMFPDDLHTYDLQLQYMLGSELLVAPVMDPNVTTVEVYLPKGSWVHVWSQKEFEGPQTMNADAPMAHPAVFYPKGSEVGAKFVENLKAFNIPIGA